MTDVRTFHYNATPFGRGVVADVRLPALREQQKRKGFKSLVHWDGSISGYRKRGLTLTHTPPLHLSSTLVVLFDRHTGMTRMRAGDSCWRCCLPLPRRRKTTRNGNHFEPEHLSLAVVILFRSVEPTTRDMKKQSNSIRFTVRIGGWLRMGWTGYPRVPWLLVVVVVVSCCNDPAGGGDSSRTNRAHRALPASSWSDSNSAPFDLHLYTQSYTTNQIEFFAGKSGAGVAEVLQNSAKPKCRAMSVQSPLELHCTAERDRPRFSHTSHTSNCPRWSKRGWEDLQHVLPQANGARLNYTLVAAAQSCADNVRCYCAMRASATHLLSPPIPEMVPHDLLRAGAGEDLMIEWFRSGGACCWLVSAQKPFSCLAARPVRPGPTHRGKS